MATAKDPSGGGSPAKPTPAPVTAGSAGMDPTSFAHAVLTKMGLPESPSNVDFMLAWMSAEGGNWHNSASYNPLNTTLKMPGMVGTMGTQGNIARYASWEQGIDATVKTLSASHYTGIVNALKASDTNAAVSALRASPWDVNHYTDAQGNSTFPIAGGANYAAQNGATPDNTPETTSAAGGAEGGDGSTTSPSDQLAESFGYSSAFFGSDPSLQKLIDKYKALPLDASGNVPQKTLDLFKAELTATPWYQQHTLNQRSWIQLQTADPAEATHQLLGVQQQLAQQAKQLGLNLAPGQLHEMANNALSMYGQNVPASVVSQMLGAQVKYKGGQAYTGQVGSDVVALQNLAHDYNVPLSDATMQSWLRNIVQNGVDPTSYTDFLKNQAASAYPTLKPQFDAGLNFTQATDTYRNDAANILEIDPNTVDFTQPKWMKALTQIDPTTGARTAMSRDQWMTTLRTDPQYGFQNTHQAQNTAAQLASTIATRWGLQNG